MIGKSRTTDLAEVGNPSRTALATPRETHSPQDGEVSLSVFPGATFECLRCGSRFSAGELARLPELTCSNCGYRIFRKVRGQVVKTLKGE